MVVFDRVHTQEYITKLKDIVVYDGVIAHYAMYIIRKYAAAFKQKCLLKPISSEEYARYNNLIIGACWQELYTCFRDNISELRLSARNNDRPIDEIEQDIIGALRSAYEQVFSIKIAIT